MVGPSAPIVLPPGGIPHPIRTSIASIALGPPWLPSAQRVAEPPPPAASIRRWKEQTPSLGGRRRSTAWIHEPYMCLWVKNNVFLGFSLKNNNNNKFLYRGKEENKTDYTASNSNQSVLALLYILYISDTPAPASPLRVGWADAALRPSPGDNAVPNGGDTGGGGQGGIFTRWVHIRTYL